MRNFLAAMLLLVPALAWGQTTTTPAPSYPINQFQGGTSLSPLMLPRWRACLAKIQAGLSTGYIGGGCPVVIVGDSVTYGIGSTSNSGNGPKPNVGDFLSLYLNQVGIPANDNGICGNGSVTGQQIRTTYDQRITAGTWASPGLIATLGGFFFQAGAVNGTAMTYTPITSYDTVAAALYAAMKPSQFISTYYAGSGNGTVTTTATGGTAVVTNEASLSGWQSITANAASASTSNALTISYSTAGSNAPNIDCIIPVNTAVPSVDIINVGMPGGIMLEWTGTGTYQFIAGLQYINPPLVVINPGVNDWDAGMSASTFLASLQSFLTNVLPTSDVIIASGLVNATNTTLQASYVQGMQQMAAANNVPFVDWNTRAVSYAYQTTLGLRYDALHDNSAGQADYTRALFNVMWAP